MTKEITRRIKPGNNRNFLARDFEGFRQQIIEQARIFFPDKIQDFSEPSVAGLLVDMAAAIGDNMSFYLDHQFRELDPSSAVEFENINTHLTNAGVSIVGAAPASVEVLITITTPAEKVETSQGVFESRPKKSSLPYIFETTNFISDSGIIFNLVEDVDFAKVKPDGEYVASFTPTAFDENGDASAFSVTRKANAISGTEAVESFTIGPDHEPFRELSLGSPDVTEIMNVTDLNGNIYHEVESLSQDTVFKEVENTRRADFEMVPKTLEVMPAPRRYVKITSPTTFRSVIRFGSGNSSALDDDIAPDPSELALSLYGKTTFPRFSIDPNSLIETQTLGISPRSTVITVTYRHGGGLSHNVDAGTIVTINSLSLEFRNNPSPGEALTVRQSMIVENPSSALGGANSPDVEFLRSLIAPSRNAQTRIVTREDLLARIYTLPARFGRVYRVGLSENPTSGLSLVVHVISQDAGGNLVTSPDTLKENLSTYLNEFRLISDAIDVVDAKVLNYRIRYEVFLDKKVNKQSTLININRRLAAALDRRFFQIDQPLVIDDIFNIIVNSTGVISVSDLEIIPVASEDTENAGTGFSANADGRIYSTGTFKTKGSVKNGILRGDPGTIFELRYPDNDITGYAI